MISFNVGWSQNESLRNCKALQFSNTVVFFLNLWILGNDWKNGIRTAGTRDGIFAKSLNPCVMQQSVCADVKFITPECPALHTEIPWLRWFSHVAARFQEKVACTAGHIHGKTPLKPVEDQVAWLELRPDLVKVKINERNGGFGMTTSTALLLCYGGEIETYKAYLHREECTWSMPSFRCTWRKI